MEKEKSNEVARREKIIEKRNDSGIVFDGMAKFEVEFVSGKRCICLTSLCGSLAEAEDAMIERFGRRFKRIII